MNWTRAMMEENYPQCSKAVALIKATHAESHFLWLTRSSASEWRDASEPQVEWSGNGGGGPGITLGSVCGKTVALSLSVDNVGGAPVCFYDVVTQMVDEAMVDKFIAQAFPGVALFKAETFDDFIADLDNLRELDAARNPGARRSAPR